VGDDVADFLVAIRRNCTDLGNGALVDWLGELAKRACVSELAFLVAGADDGDNSLIDATLEGGGVGAGRNGLHAFTEDGLGQNGCCGGAVAGDIGSLGGDFFHELRANVLQRVLELDFLGYGHAVLGDGGRAKLLLDYDVASLGAERRLDGVRERVHAAQDRLTGIFTVQNLLCHSRFS